MISDGTEWSHMSQNSPRWDRMVPDWVEKSDKGYKALSAFLTEWRSLRWDRMLSNGAEWYQMGQNGPRWDIMVPYRTEWFRLNRKI